MAGRQVMSLWFWLGFWQNYAGKGKRKWRFPEFIKQKKYKSQYFMHDSFGKYYYRFLICPFRGHKNKQYIPDDGYKYCFDCEQLIGE